GGSGHRRLGAVVVLPQHDGEAARGSVLDRDIEGLRAAGDAVLVLHDVDHHREIGDGERRAEGDGRSRRVAHRERAGAHERDAAWLGLQALRPHRTLGTNRARFALRALRAGGTRRANRPRQTSRARFALRALRTGGTSRTFRTHESLRTDRPRLALRTLRTGRARGAFRANRADRILRAGGTDWTLRTRLALIALIALRARRTLRAHRA